MTDTMGHSFRPARVGPAALLATLLASLLTAGAAVAADSSRKGGMMGGHDHPACEGPPLECARKATPAFAPDGTLGLLVTDGARVHLLWSRDRGATFGEAVEITRGPSPIDPGADHRPQLVLGPGELVTVGYAVSTDRPFVGDILHAVSRDGGRSFTPPAPVNGDPAGKRFLSLQADPAGGRIFGAWIDKRGLAAAEAAGRPYAGAALAGAWLDLSTGRFGEPLIIQEHTCECCRIGLAFAAPGKPVLAWRNLYGPARDHAVLTFDRPDRPGEARRVSDDDWQIEACPHHGPALALGRDGSYQVAWFTLSDRRQGLFHAWSGDQGRSFSPPRPLGNPDRQPARPQLLAATDGLWLAWQEFDGEQTLIVVEHSTDDGRNWSAPRVLASSPGTTDQPVLVADAAGRGWLSWLSRPEGYRLLPLAP